MQLWDWDLNHAHESMQGLVRMRKCIVLTPPQGCIQDFCQGGANLEYVKKKGGEAVRSWAAAGGWVQEGDVPPPAQNFNFSEIHLYEL